MLITHDKIYISGDWLSPAQATYIKPTIFTDVNPSMINAKE